MNAVIQRIPIDRRTYDLHIYRRTILPPDAPRLVVVSAIPNADAMRILRVCLAAIRRFTPEPHELWVVDNCSPARWHEQLRGLPDVNLVLNRTRPLPPGYRMVHEQLSGRLTHSQAYLSQASYENAIGLELAVRLVEPETRYLMTLHMDTMPCRAGWLSFLQGKIDQGYAAVGVRMDTNRTTAGVLHILGLLLDFQAVRRLGLDFLPDLPQHDVGDLITIRLRSAGHALFACRNTLPNPEFERLIPEESPLYGLRVDRAFDDADRVIFVHLGRGLQKATGRVQAGTGVQSWLALARDLGVVS